MGMKVAGAPYSGEQISEHVQTLADGTHITQPQNSEKIYRDSEGRTRTERTMGQGMGAASKGKYVMIEIRDPVAGAYYVIDDQNKVVHKMAMTAPPQRVRTPPTEEQKAAAAKARAENTNEKLGTQSIEGVLAEGTRSTQTIPIGEQGNDRPMVTTNEFWYSQEIKAMVLSKSNGPQIGENTTKLINISRAEPDASLFQPPAGYNIVEEKDSFTMTVKRQ